MALEKPHPEERRYISREVFYGKLNKDEEGILYGLSGASREILIGIDEMTSPDPITWATAIKKLPDEEREIALNALENLAEIQMRKYQYETHFRPIAGIRIPKLFVGSGIYNQGFMRLRPSRVAEILQLCGRDRAIEKWREISF